MDSAWDMGLAGQCEEVGTPELVRAIWIDNYPYYFTIGEIGKLGNIYRLRKIYRLCDVQGLRWFITALDLEIAGPFSNGLLHGGRSGDAVVPRPG